MRCAVNTCGCAPGSPAGCPCAGRERATRLFNAPPDTCQCRCHWAASVWLCWSYPIRSCDGTPYRTLFAVCRSPNAEAFYDTATWVLEAIGMGVASIFQVLKEPPAEWIERHSNDSRALRMRARTRWGSHWCVVAAAPGEKCGVMP